jgi:hypothetical protein
LSAGIDAVPRLFQATLGSKPFSSRPCASRPAKAVAPSTQSSPQFGLFLDASIWVSSGPVELSSSLTGMPVAFWKAATAALS